MRRVIGAVLCWILVTSLPLLAGAQPPVERESEPAIPRIGLQEAIARAIKRNPDITLALQEIRRAQALIVESRSRTLPYLSANASFTRLDHDRTIEGRVFQNANQLSLDFFVNVPIVSAVTWIQTKQAKYYEEVSKLDALEVRRQLALATAHAYLSVLAQHRVIAVDRRALENSRGHYAYAHTRNLGGIGNQLDDTRASQEVASNEATLQQSLAALYQQQEALGVLVGANTPLDVQDALQLPGLPALDPDETPQRGDVLSAKRRVRAAKHLAKGNWADFVPALYATFMPFYQKPPTPVMPRLGWAAAAYLSVPMVSGGLRVGLIRERAALLAQSRAQLEGIVRQAKSEVRASLDYITRADLAFESAARAAQLADDALGMANIAYEAGATTNIEVIDAERAARDAETYAVIAEDAALRARLDLLAATGNLP